MSDSNYSNLSAPAQAGMPPADVGWLPEQPLLLYPSLAIEVGVEEALLISVLSKALTFAEQHHQQGFLWFTLSEAQLTAIAPFWQARDIQRLCTNLRESGVLLIASAPYTQSQLLKFAFQAPKQFHSAKQQPAKTLNNAATPNAQAYNTQAPQGTAPNFIAPHWQPERDTLTQLAQLSIPERFALDQVAEFITYWRDRKEAALSWEAKFFHQVIKKWREFQSQENSRPQTTAITKDWRPSEDAMDVLTRHAGINQSFIEDAIPEFVLFWREQGGNCDNWNRRFRDHVNRQWAKFTSTLEHDPTPKRINDGWKPSRDVYDVLRLANIDLQFAQHLIPEFVIYWRDSNQVHSSWNTKFLQYVKRRWAQRGNEVAPSQGSSTRDISLEALVTDRSWAD